MNKLILQTSKNVALSSKVENAKKYLSNSKAQNTLKAYHADINHFIVWCEENKLESRPSGPETITLYLSDLAEQGRKVSIIRRRLYAIKMFNESEGYPNPISNELVKQTISGIQREIGSAPKQKKPILAEDIRKMIEVLPETLMGMRDKALLLLGFSGAFRRSELVTLNIEDIEFTKGGVTVNLKKSKTDQKKEGYKKGIPYGSNLATCPVRALQDWLEATAIEGGAIFRSIRKGDALQETRLTDKEVARIVKRTAEKAGLNPDDFAGHSLRAGFATQAAMNLARFDKIMEQGGWKSEMTVKRYIRDGNIFRDNAASKLGL